jgi:2-oxoisovalerate ferredoxin oxidoreductase beta subunit
VRQLGIPFTEVAVAMRKQVVKNVVALGALQAATNLFPAETFLAALRQALKEKPQYIALNEEAFARGQKAIAVQAPA